MGGNAGNSADITVLVKEEDMDLLSLLGQTSNCVPKGGPKGDFGLGGAGGIGGRGGASYSGHNGERSYTNAGGMNGPNGVAGMNGELLRPYSYPLWLPPTNWCVSASAQAEMDRWARTGRRAV
jgi:hypothetical protein